MQARCLRSRREDLPRRACYYTQHMNKLIFALLGALFVVGLSVSTNAQAPMRVNFERGMDRTILTGTLRGYADKKSFVLRVKKGQRLTTQNIGKNYVTVEIVPPKGSKWEPDLAADCHDHHEVNPTAAGDYVIRVTECRKADRWRGTFRVRVVVR